MQSKRYIYLGYIEGHKRAGLSSTGGITSNIVGYLSDIDDNLSWQEHIENSVNKWFNSSGYDKYTIELDIHPLSETDGEMSLYGIVYAGYKEGWVPGIRTVMTNPEGSRSLLTKEKIKTTP